MLLESITTKFNEKEQIYLIKFLYLEPYPLVSKYTASFLKDCYFKGTVQREKNQYEFCENDFSHFWLTVNCHS